ncbi:AGR127Cp [Eremothecium gossypii ATCC 10895]|uniref:serine C-palmitoyltransferase n=1 Tax=Eremothecium gossypii (strain ATCC 10895 / CBS 109.51 / FGSC 9923 / NRRL Y-1056) TaxID=284811 RepID=Q74ZS1_EREGS|nr:AGR127Cp [Eremothecium gossypii ATCC 10895]AAS54617.2 AGR127Cp [Eremothecium gossypii ATCC 10895]AEY98947.1 FAGR127Cp [Eremothecium gossypii FDAG1]
MSSLSNTRVPLVEAEAVSMADKKENEFGELTSEAYLYAPRSRKGAALREPVLDAPPYYISVITYLNYLILIILGHVHDFFGLMFQKEKHRDIMERDGLAPWFSKFESFFVRRMKQRIDDCFSRPTTGVPGRFIRCIDRIAHSLNEYFTFPGTTSMCLNLSSYNYLGFAQSEGLCTDAAVDSVHRYGINTHGSRMQSGTTDLHVEAERYVANFLGMEDAMIFSMGYGTNANLFNSFLDNKCLVISDELNHTSIRTGVRLSDAAVRTFKHNDMEALEKLIREQIIQGQPKTHRPWKKILICVEGLYSMEGTMCNLPKLIELKKKYKCYLYVDEAHSIGAMGPHGRGVCDYFGVDPTEVDILMGTLTKSFGAAGGYVAAQKWIIDRLRLDLTTSNYGEPSPAPVLAQIISSMRIIIGELNPGEGLERLQRIAFNSRYLRLALQRLGFIVYGIADSPVIPMLLYAPSKMPAFSRMMLQRKIAVVVVAYPATPLIESRVRFCVSAALTKEDIDYLLRHVDEVGDKLFLKVSSGRAGGSSDGKPPRWDIEEVLRRTPEDCKDDKYFLI